jgi:sRNA-binding protein
MDLEERVSAWGDLAGEVGRELAAWRAEHPRAALAEIEAAVQAAVQRLQARYLEDVVAASAAADLAGVPPAERPRCPACGGTLTVAGQQTRAVLTPGQTTPLRLRRSYTVCAACQSGVFPPG